MKLNVVPRANVDAETARWYREVAQQVNAVSEGRLSGSYTASTAAPTTGTWTVGDKVRNSAPAEAGTAGSKYVVEGWICTVAGTPGTWLQQRTLTGN
jgi:hypothetical protein